MIKTILIANRGEIACRIIRTCKKMGIKSIAVFSDIDKNALHVQEADGAIGIGGNEPAQSYLDIDKIIKAAHQSGADAIHPGYGFLSENATFSKKCQKENIIFIGPHPKAIEQMGSKSLAKAIMQEHNVPTVPGYQGENQSKDYLYEQALQVGFPLLLKATAGGGGKGMRIVNEEKELKNAIDAAQREAKNAFGDDELIIERYFPSVRHIEFQILGDKHGNYFHLLERECSIQRRYQKIIEESPSSALDNELRNQMAEAAVQAAKAIEYDNAGTVEFILANDGQFYFLEVNTRLQVEHPVTEEITGLDLVQLQIEVAEGKELSLKQEDIRANGYAVECRLYAEDAENDFMPATGTILNWSCPKMQGLRIETGVQSGSQVSVFYDPMIAKIITHAPTREEAHRKMHFALEQIQCLGLTTNQDFLKALFENDQFFEGNYDTHFLKNHFNYKKESINQDSALIACLLYRWQKREAKRTLLKNMPSAWRNNFYQAQQETYTILGEEYTIHYKYSNNIFNIHINNNEYQCELLNTIDNNIQFIINDNNQEIIKNSLYNFNIFINNKNEYFTHNIEMGSQVLRLKNRFPEKEIAREKGTYQSHIPAQVLQVLVKEGDRIKEGDALVILSSMKMETTIEADVSGTVTEVYVAANENIEAGVLLLKIEE